VSSRRQVAGFGKGVIEIGYEWTIFLEQVGSNVEYIIQLSINLQLHVRICRSDSNGLIHASHHRSLDLES